MAHALRFTITATATITVVRFLHLFKFGLVVYGASVAPSTGGNREIPAFVFEMIKWKIIIPSTYAKIVEKS